MGNNSLDTAKIAAALHQVMQKVSYVQKDSMNDFHKYKYASEAALLAALRPAMIEAGLILIPSISMVKNIDEFGNTHIEMEYTLVHKDGDVWPYPIRAAGAGNDKAKTGAVGDKGVYKAITGANKYLLFKLFQIETGDDPEVARENESPFSEKDANTYLETMRFAANKAEKISELGDLWRQHTKQMNWLSGMQKASLDKELKAIFANRKAEITANEGKVEGNE
jgi:hypothetical protein